jgi:hypothetical protein
MTATSSLRHVVLFAFKDNASTGAIDTVVADFGQLPKEIPGITAYEWGTNVSPEGLDNGFTHCFTLSFATAQDRDAYLVHPAHERFVGTLAGCLERSLVLDYWTQA